MSGTPGSLGLPILVADPPAPVAGAIFYIVGTELRYRTSSAGPFVIGITSEGIEDIIGNLIQDSTSIDVNYDDPSNILTLAVIQSAIDHGNIQNNGSNTHAQIDTHLASSANPHGVTPAQIGAELSGAVAAHELAVDPHPQYQLETGLTAAIAAYLDRRNDNSDTTQVRTTVGFEDRFNLSIDLNHDSALYIARLDYDWSYDNRTSNFEAELLINGTVVRTHQQEPKDAGGGSINGSGTDQRHPAGFSKIFTAQPGNNTFQFRFGPEVGGVEATIHEHTLTIGRWI